MAHNPFLQSRARSLISGYHGNSITVEPKTREGLYICHSSDLSVTITKKCAKAGLEACRNLSVYFNAPVMTEMCEITSSQNIDLYLSRGVTLRTITIDMCSRVNVHVQDAAAQLFKIYYHQSSDTKLVKHEGGPVQRIELDTMPVNNEKQTVQFVCRIHADGQIQIDQVVREAKGYPTTEEELAEQAEQQQMEEEIMLKRFRDQILFISRLDEDSSEDSSPNNSPP